MITKDCASKEYLESRVMQPDSKRWNESTNNPLGSPQGRHFDNGRTILPQGSPQGRHLQSPLGKGSLRKSPLAGE